MGYYVNIDLVLSVGSFFFYLSMVWCYLCVISFVERSDQLKLVGE